MVMKAFRFPLQAVLTIRLNQESKAQEAFVRAQTELQQLTARQREIRQAIEEAQGLRRDILKKSANCGNIQRLQQGLTALHGRMRQCEAELQKAQAVLDAKSRDLLEARQKREIVEKLYEKQFAQYQAAATRAEQKVLDDLATLKSIGSFALKWK